MSLRSAFAKVIDHELSGIRDRHAELLLLEQRRIAHERQARVDAANDAAMVADRERRVEAHARVRALVQP